MWAIFCRFTPVPLLHAFCAAARGYGGRLPKLAWRNLNAAALFAAASARAPAPRQPPIF